MASAGMPCSAAAFVTSGSLAAPSSIEYSVWTCRCAKESDELVTGGRAPQWSCVPGRQGLRRATGGEDRRASPPERRLGFDPDPRTGSCLRRGSDRTCLIPGGPIGHMRPVRWSQVAPHGDVRDTGLLVLLA